MALPSSVERFVSLVADRLNRGVTLGVARYWSYIQSNLSYRVNSIQSAGHPD